MSASNSSKKTLGSKQLDKFKEAARDLECDDDEQRFDERLKKLVRHKSEPEKPEMKG